MQESEISPYLVMEPPDRQVAANLPVYVSRDDFSPYEQNHLCGFGEIGSTDTNYKHCLVRVTLKPEYRQHFDLVHSEMTVQVTNGELLFKILNRSKKLGGGGGFFSRNRFRLIDSHKSEPFVGNIHENVLFLTLCIKFVRFR